MPRGDGSPRGPCRLLPPAARRAAEAPRRSSIPSPTPGTRSPAPSGPPRNIPHPDGKRPGASVSLETKPAPNASGSAGAERRTVSINGLIAPFGGAEVSVRPAPSGHPRGVSPGCGGCLRAVAAGAARRCQPRGNPMPRAGFTGGAKFKLGTHGADWKQPALHPSLLSPGSTGPVAPRCLEAGGTARRSPCRVSQAEPGARPSPRPQRTAAPSTAARRPRAGSPATGGVAWPAIAPPTPRPRPHGQRRHLPHPRGKWRPPRRLATAPASACF